jgi:hypothetical protein
MKTRPTYTGAFQRAAIRRWPSDAPQAQAWVPFAPPRRAFVLYACWEQANLRGSHVKLIKLEEQEALLEIEPIEFRLYRETSQLRQQVEWDAYKRLYETIGHDRAAHAGWELNIAYDGKMCILRFGRQTL